MDTTSILGTAVVGAVLLLMSGSCAQPAVAPASANSNATARVASPTKGELQRVTFTTKDAAGVAIVGDLYLPDKTPAPAIIAIHQFQASKATYATFGRAMRDAGFVVLAIDARGFGESTKSLNGTVAPGWDTQPDIAAALAFLKSQPGVDASRVGLIGASYGASNVLIFAADNPADVRSVVLLSVGLNYHGSLPTAPALQKYGDRPLLMLAARDDVDDGPQTTALAATVKNPSYRVQMYEKGGHGTSLLGTDVGGLDIVKTFFMETLAGHVAGPSAAADTTNRANVPAGREGSAKP